MILRGFTNNTLLTRGLSSGSILDRIIGIFITSKIFPIINISSRFLL